MIDVEKVRQSLEVAKEYGYSGVTVDVKTIEKLLEFHDGSTERGINFGDMCGRQTYYPTPWIGKSL